MFSANWNHKSKFMITSKYIGHRPHEIKNHSMLLLSFWSSPELQHSPPQSSYLRSNALKDNHSHILDHSCLWFKTMAPNLLFLSKNTYSSNKHMFVANMGLLGPTKTLRLHGSYFYKAYG